jgi:hypothetical protein
LLFHTTAAKEREPNHPTLARHSSLPKAQLQKEPSPNFSRFVYHARDRTFELTGRGEQHPTVNANYKLKNEVRALRSNELLDAAGRTGLVPNSVISRREKYQLPR